MRSSSSVGVCVCAFALLLLGLEGGCGGTADSGGMGNTPGSGGTDRGTGGAPGTGGTPGTGGAPGTGGTPGTGGFGGEGGSVVPLPPVPAETLDIAVTDVVAVTIEESRCVPDRGNSSFSASVSAEDGTLYFQNYRVIDGEGLQVTGRCGPDGALDREWNLERFFFKSEYRDDETVVPAEEGGFFYVRSDVTGVDVPEVGRVDADGELAWSDDFGGQTEFWSSIAATDDAVYVLGESDQLPGQPVMDEEHPFIARFGKDGSRVWAKTFDLPLFSDLFRLRRIPFAADADSNLYMVLRAASGGLQVIKWDADGNVLWSAPNYGLDSYPPDTTIFQVEDLAVAKDGSGVYLGAAIGLNAGVLKFVRVLKIDSDGVPIWVKHVYLRHNDAPGDDVTWTGGLSTEWQKDLWSIEAKGDGFCITTSYDNTINGLDGELISRRQRTSIACFDGDANRDWAYQYDVELYDREGNVVILPLDAKSLRVLANDELVVGHLAGVFRLGTDGLPVR